VTKKLEMNMESINEHMAETMQGLGVGDATVALIKSYLNLAHIVGQSEGVAEAKTASLKAIDETLGAKETA
jgi:hypothetical protein